MTSSSLFPAKMSAASSATAGRASIASAIAAKGLARYIVLPTRKLFRYTGQTTDLDSDVIALIHEVGHVFGAEHVDDFNSIMHENFDYRSRIRRQEPRRSSKTTAPAHLPNNSHGDSSCSARSVERLEP